MNFQASVSDTGLKMEGRQFLLLAFSFFIASPGFISAQTNLHSGIQQGFQPPKGWQRLIIQRTGDHPKFAHDIPPPAEGTIMFDAIFDKEFLHQVLHLYDEISQLQVQGYLKFKDVCMKAPSGECIMLSLLQYYQHNAIILDRKVMDASGFFVLSDYLDHFDFCSNFPYSANDTLGKFYASCLSQYGTPVFPFHVLQNYDGTNFNNATALVTTIPYNVDSHTDIIVSQWQEELRTWLSSYGNPNMTFTLEEPKPNGPVAYYTGIIGRSNDVELTQN